ncbi:MAG: hypothetical protein ACFFDT_17235 [Candidatus Hodarchaeota archaeon]
MYKKLREILHTHPAGAPPSKAIDEILRILFTPAEVEIASKMIFRPQNIQTIAKQVDLPEDEIKNRCESMANKGILFSREKDGEMGYALLPTIPGIFEFPFMRGGGTPTHDELAKLWLTYHQQALGNEFAGSETPLTRVVPIEQTIIHKIEVLPFEVLSKMLKGEEIFALAQCACRVSVHACEKLRDVCLIFGLTGKFLMTVILHTRLPELKQRVL